MTFRSVVGRRGVRAFSSGGGLVLGLLLALPTFAFVSHTVTTTTSLGNPVSAMAIGEELTIDITLRNNADDPLFVVGASVKGWDPNVFEFVEGRALTTLFNTFCFEGSGCFGGLGNAAGQFASGAPRILEEENPSFTPGPRIRYAATETTVPVTEDGSVDLGVATGLLGGPQAQVVFRRIGLGSSDFLIGSHEDYFEGANYIGIGDVPSQNAIVSVAAIPEPSTGVLIGLGLTGLTRFRRSPI